MKIFKLHFTFFMGEKKTSFLHPARSNTLLKSQENNFLVEDFFFLYVLLQGKFNNSATLLSL